MYRFWCWLIQMSDADPMQCNAQDAMTRSLSLDAAFGSQFKWLWKHKMYLEIGTRENSSSFIRQCCYFVWLSFQIFPFPDRERVTQSNLIQMPNKHNFRPVSLHVFCCLHALFCVCDGVKQYFPIMKRTNIVFWRQIDWQSEKKVKRKFSWCDIVCRISVFLFRASCITYVNETCFHIGISWLNLSIFRIYFVLYHQQKHFTQMGK